MNLVRLTSELFVVDGVDHSDLEDLQNLCVRSVVHIRAAMSSSPKTQSLEDLAGVEAQAFALEGELPSFADGRRFGQLLDGASRPVLLCGDRVEDLATLWAMSQIDRIPLLTIMTVGKAAGFDFREVADAVSAARRRC